MLKIGLTGGIGCGKSTVAALFELLQVPVYYADERAKKIMENDPGLISEIQTLLGKESYTDGRLNKKHIASILFKDAELTKKLNALVHPKTISDAEQWMQIQSKKGYPYAVKEAALIFESNAQEQLDFVVGVSSPLHIRLQRIQKRDQSDIQQILDRISRQMDEVEKMKRCDFIIRNNEEELMIPQVLSLHEKLITLSKTKSGQS